MPKRHPAATECTEQVSIVVGEVIVLKTIIDTLTKSIKFKKVLFIDASAT